MAVSMPRSAADDIPVAVLLRTLLDRVSGDIPGTLGAALSVAHHGEPLTVLVATGIGDHLAPAQTQLFGGPIPDAAATSDPTVTDNVFTDSRWPKLTLDSITEQFPQLTSTWRHVRGVAALPSYYDEDSALVLSVTLDHSGTSEALRVLTRYEAVVTATLVVAEAHGAAGSEQMMAVLRSRAAIEQAKGVIIGIRRCGPEEAWATLRRASQEFNVKIRDLAVALVEHLGHTPQSTPEGIPVIVPTPEARHAAERLWTAFTTPGPE
ncbi:ANTAR domain-containing protein [Amycolatopsis oliviviridis]|uniref:ANTAR domain-containing protein n=1 Tax=Amycolatopsis oliviviridis TaxID=1471590 RepID=A0ABQ3MCK6_9PSEU|nr:ANTAR domain-containing protein [Amycolatopsis oliviviridis]GHH37942.1 ANTAR domain-containing protein [Amycolatopsis oliviviridis]